MKVTIDLEKDLSELNYLKPEEKVLVVKAYTLIEEAREKMKRKGTDVSLPYRMQLKSDFGEIERLLKKLKPERSNEKHMEKLSFLVTKLETEMKHILGQK